MRAKHLWPIAAIMLVGCNQETGMITNKEPFYQKGYQLPLRLAPYTLSEIEGFAKAHGLKLKKSTNHFKEGEFTATLISDDMNIVVNNVALGDTVWVAAISRSSPNSGDKALVEQLVSSINLGPATSDEQPPITPPA